METSVAELDRVLSFNLRPVWMVTQRAVPQLEKTKGTCFSDCRILIEERLRERGQNKGTFHVTKRNGQRVGGSSNSNQKQC